MEKNFEQKNIQQIAELTQKEEEKIEKNIKYLLENLAIIISISTVFILLMLYSFNKGFYRAYNIPANCIKVNLVDFLPATFQLCTIYIYFLLYLIQLKKDRILKINKFNISRIAYGFIIISNIFVNSNINYLIGAKLTFCISISIPIIIELTWMLIKNKDNLNQKKILLTEFIEVKMLYLINNKYALGIIIIIILLAYNWGTLNALAKTEYQIFTWNNTTYAVIIDQDKNVIAQKSKINNKKLTIDTTSFTYLPKENITFKMIKYNDILLFKDNNRHTTI